MKKAIRLILSLMLLSFLFYGCLPFQTEPGDTTKEVTLYFGNQDATAVVGETRDITIEDEKNKEGIINQVLQELIKGPQNQDLSPTIPKEVKILSVTINNGIAHVDFSEEMQTNHPGGAAGESMTINSIVNTLTEFEYIEQVKMTVEGQPMNLEHAVLEEPIGRNENMIAK